MGVFREVFGEEREPTIISGVRDSEIRDSEIQDSGAGGRLDLHIDELIGHFERTGC